MGEEKLFITFIDCLLEKAHFLYYCGKYHIYIERPICARLSFVGNSYYKIYEACTIKYAYLIYTSFLHSTVINPYSDPTSYYDTRSLCKHGKLNSPFCV